MATFYLLPPRGTLNNELKGLLGKLLPGLPISEEAWDLLIDTLSVRNCWPSSLFLIPRDDFPNDEWTPTLIANFGAEEGDEIVEVEQPAGGEARRWIVSQADMSAAAAA